MRFFFCCSRCMSEGLKHGALGQVAGGRFPVRCFEGDTIGFAGPVTTMGLTSTRPNKDQKKKKHAVFDQSIWSKKFTRIRY